VDRRTLLKSSLSAAALSAFGAGSASVAFGAAPPGANYRNLLVLIELKGGNDGLNTVVPFTSSTYYALRPKLAIARDAVLPLSDTAGLHPALAPLVPMWKSSEVAILQGVGYPAPNLSHFRSIEIWDTASASSVYLQDGWLTRAFTATPPPRGFAADGVIIGTNDLGPLAGGGTRAVALTNTDQFLRQAKLPPPRATRTTRRFSMSSRSRPTSCRRRAGSTRAACSPPSFRQTVSAMRSAPPARSSRTPRAWESCG